MAFDLRDVDQTTREQMLVEFHDDLESGRLYISERLSPSGRLAYPEFLEAAFQEGTPETLAQDLGAPGVLNATERARNPRGGPDTVKRVPITAPATMAEGEFNRFYARGLCRRVLLDDPEAVVRVYRARDSSRPRPESEAKVGSEVRAQALLDDLRAHVGIDTALGMPPGPNSGLSVCMP